MANYSAEILIEFVRNGLIEQYHSGFIIKLNSDGCYTEIGNSIDYPFYLRSCAKPLQASLIIDYGADKFYNLSLDEIAICCASHSGEECHLSLIKNFMKKTGLAENMLKCGIHKPLSLSMQQQMLIKGEKESAIHNNCSGKHVMMLALSKMKKWDLKSYDNIEHPLQKEIRNKIYTLCELKNNYPITKDGCGVPIFSMPLKNMLKGYINLFCSEKYSKITKAFLQNPYLIGGENRLDSAIIKNGDSLIAKVGAGGLCIVVNTKLKEGFIVKISDSDMHARAIVVSSILRHLNWLKSEDEDFLAQCATDILTLNNEKVGEAKLGDWINMLHK